MLTAGRVHQPQQLPPERQLSRLLSHARVQPVRCTLYARVAVTRHPLVVRKNENKSREKSYFFLLFLLFFFRFIACMPVPAGWCVLRVRVRVRARLFEAFGGDKHTRAHMVGVPQTN